MPNDPVYQPGVTQLRGRLTPRQRVRRWGAVLWPSFLLAGAATGVFFAHIDPEDLRAATYPEWTLSRELGYTVGFFMFWLVAAASSLLTKLLLCSPHCPWQQIAGSTHEQR